MQKQNSTGDIVDVTNVGRTLVDIAVRPEYSGGVQNVLDAYRLARATTSVDAFLAILKGLYIYPYQQVVGFYFQRAGYDKSIWERLKQEAFPIRLYLAHGMSDRSYNSAGADSGWDLQSYEVQPDRVVFYLWPRAGGTTVSFSLKAPFPMKAQSSQSTLYDYYNPQARASVPLAQFTMR